ncbi:MAG: hypothetical protein ACE15B_09325 [Bryobacteraceae bacterium]
MFKSLLPLTLLVTLVSPVACASSSDAWKQLLSLAGEWEGTKGGRTAIVTYTVISGGSALMESMKMPAPEPDMVTIYHRDGDALVATHYCSMGNQPRMRAPGGGSPDGKSIRFRFADITNLAKPDGGHIRHLTVTFDDANHFTQEWISYSKGKEEPVTFKWTRRPKK